ncbi:hypothetical protein NCCP2222_01630 [Sporosarcina sp. NCCP-2222]|uniref:DUF3006 domain-containing protein n=1 Tax=Sporosarcina sp. NCCP-2222 TaxID=2935073 RepID=UPI002088875D|nr:DUF3006 domain-containing protein [Sporosarcina sp. NCCP-2222]GKV54216.1 hypothetical protein NCCP2222_01630 [Sporosarcina sp. NCCP-2222]
MTKKYTLDRIEESVYVFVESPEEEKQLLIPVNKYNGSLTEGDIVLIEDDIIIEVLDQETKEMKTKVNSLMEKLRNKNK